MQINEEGNDEAFVTTPGKITPEDTSDDPRPEPGIAPLPPELAAGDYHRFLFWGGPYAAGSGTVFANAGNLGFTGPSGWVSGSAPSIDREFMFEHVAGSITSTSPSHLGWLPATMVYTYPENEEEEDGAYVTTPGKITLEDTYGRNGLAPPHDGEWHLEREIRVIDGTYVSIEAVDDEGAEEDEDIITFRVSRSGGSTTGSLVVNLHPGAGTAKGADYTGMPSSVTILANEEYVEFDVTPVDDGDYEEAETVVAILKASDTYWLTTALMAEGVIGDNELEIDLDIDSDNDDEFSAPGRTAVEDQAEDNASKPGKIVAVNDDDSDGDGIPDFADGYDLLSELDDDSITGGEGFVAIILQLPDGVDPEDASFTIDYDGSDPMEVDAEEVEGPDEYTFVYTPASGSLRLWTKAGDQARDGEGLEGDGDYIRPDTEYSWTDLGGSGTTRTIWLEAIHPSAALGDGQIILTVNINGGGEGSDAVRVTAVAVDIAMDNDRDGMIEVDGQDDATTPDRPFLFWLNDNRDVWGGRDYLAAVYANPGSITDYGDPNEGKGIGRRYVGNAAATREVGERDLEDFAAMGLRWSGAIEPYVTGVRIRLVSDNDPQMEIRVFESSRKGGLVGNEMSATAHVDDTTVMGQILAKNEFFAGRALKPGGSEIYQPGMAGFNNFWGTTDGSAGMRLVQFIFEGGHEGDGKIVFDLMHGNAVLASSSMELRLHPMNELYDHYSVAYGENVDSTDGTFKNNVNPLTMAEPVPVTADLKTENQERERFQEQSDDYFVFVHGWRNREWERVATAQTTYKRMFWSGYQGQFGMFDWPTQWVDLPATDPGNFDRSEFIAWNSGAGLKDALEDIRSNKMDSEGKLSVMAHSMGNIPVSEALYLAQNDQDDLVDVAIFSQAALSSHYFASNGLPSIYVANPGTMWTDHVIQHTNPSWTEYRGFNPGGNIDAIGGVTPRFRNIWESAGKLLNYYNPDDYALATWKLVQALKPTAPHDTIDIGLGTLNLNFGNVPLSPNWRTWYQSLSAPLVPGFNNTQYFYDPTDNKFHRYGVGVGNVALSLANNLYETFAFGASSMVAALGGVDSMNGLAGVFDSGANLNQVFGQNSKFNNLNTGHSAQFVHSFASTKGYWAMLKGDVE